MEIRAFTIKYSKQKAKATHNEEKRLLIRLGQLQESLGRKYSDMDKVEMNKMKTKLEKISAFKVAYYSFPRLFFCRIIHARTSEISSQRAENTREY